VKKLSEIMAEKAAKKEQRRAEIEAKKVEQKGAAIVAQIARLPGRVPAFAVERLIRSFASVEGRQKVRAGLSKSHVGMLDSIEAQIDDAWLERAADLLRSVPDSQQGDVRFISDKQWLQYGAAVGMPESDLVSVLGLLFIFGGNVGDYRGGDREGQGL
jgi:hypothetical protein